MVYQKINFYFVIIDVGFVLKCLFVISVVIGVIKLWQLCEIFDVVCVYFSEDILVEIDCVYE